MAFAYTFHENFEDGTSGNFNSETDANGVLNILQYKHLIRQKDTNPTPYRGAYVVEVDLNGADTNQFLQENDGFDISAGNSLNIMFQFFVTTDLTMATSDRFTIFRLQSSGPTDEVVIDIVNNSGTIQVGAAETGATAVGSGAFGDLITGQWHTAELAVTIDAGGGNDGTIDFYLDGNQIGSQITSLDQGAITQAQLGIIGVDAGSTAGRVYFSEIIADDARIYPHPSRFQNPRTITKSEHLFVGPGYLEEIALVSAGNSDMVVKVYDSDTANVNADEGHKIELDWDAHTSYSTPVRFEKGCYVELAGTNPRAIAKYVENEETAGVLGPLAISDMGYRMVAFR